MLGQIRLSLACGFLLSAGELAFSQSSWFVSPIGSDSDNDCLNPDYPCASIAHALAVASLAPETEGDTIQILPGVYTETGLVISRALRLVGAGPGETIVQAAPDVSSASNRVLQIPLGVEAEIRHMTVRHGRAPDGRDDNTIGGDGGAGGGILNNGVLRLFDVHVISNRAGNGGAGAIGGGGGLGGGIYCDGVLYVSNCVVGFNRAGDGGAGSTAGGTGGGGAGIHNSGTAEIWFSSIIDNQAGNGGSGEIQSGGAGNGGIWNSGLLMLYTCLLDGTRGGTPGRLADRYAGIRFNGRWAVGGAGINQSDLLLDDFIERRGQRGRDSQCRRIGRTRPCLNPRVRWWRIHDFGARLDRGR